LPTIMLRMQRSIWACSKLTRILLPGNSGS
jgi:hypothetical protein